MITKKKKTLSLKICIYLARHFILSSSYEYAENRRLNTDTFEFPDLGYVSGM